MTTNSVFSYKVGVSFDFDAAVDSAVQFIIRVGRQKTHWPLQQILPFSISRATVTVVCQKARVVAVSAL